MATYMSWAIQSTTGNLFCMDLYTAEPNRAVFFNVYFWVVGLISGITAKPPIFIMTIISLFASPIVIFILSSIMRRLGFDRRTIMVGLFLCIFSSGLSGIVTLANKLFGTDFPIGLDILGGDLIPITSFMVFPFHATAIIFIALASFWMVITLNNINSGNYEVRVVAIAAIFLLFLGFVRQYEVITITISFVISNALLINKKTVKFRVCSLIIIIIGLLPFGIYNLYISTLPVWRDIAHISATFHFTSMQAVIGFLPIWLTAAIGSVFAWKRRRNDLTFFICWWLFTMGALIFYNGGSKLAGFCSIADGILGAYGLTEFASYLRQKFPRHMCALIDHPFAKASFAVFVLLIFAATPVLLFANIVRYGAPQVDREILTAGARIRQAAGSHIPLILTDAATGNLLPGLFGFRVYAGHMYLTPDIAQKEANLIATGIEPFQKSGDPDRLASLIEKLRPDYFLLGKATVAFADLMRCADIKTFYDGQRWAVLRWVPMATASIQAASCPVPPA